MDNFQRVDAVVDRIASLVDESVERSPFAPTRQDLCSKCGTEWHGMQKGYCPGPFQDRIDPAKLPSEAVHPKANAPQGASPRSTSWGLPEGMFFAASCEQCRITLSWDESDARADWIDEHRGSHPTHWVYSGYSKLSPMNN